MNLAERVRDRRKQLGLTQSELADLAGTTQQGIVSIESGRTKRPRYLHELAKALKCEADWLLFGTENNNVSYVGPNEPKGSYPLISWVSAGAWSEACEPYTLDEIDEWYESGAHVEGSGFWLRVQGDSMTASKGLSIPEGMLILIDTGREAKNGSLVVAKLTDANEATFKKYVLDEGVGQKFLQPLNPSYPIIPVNGNCRIIGVAVETKMFLV